MLSDAMNRELDIGTRSRDPVTFDSKAPVPAFSMGEYAELKRLVKEKGLLEKQPGYYTYKIFLTLGMLAGSIALMFVLGSHWLQLLNAVLLAFVFTQIGFIGHDAGHQQVFRVPWKNEIINLVVNFLLGVSRTWWVDKHNRHHSNPNQLRLDPDTFIPVLAFSEDQALSRHGFYGLVVRYQAYLFIPMLCLEGLGVRLASLQYMLRKKVKYSFAEPLLAGLSLIPLLGLPFYLMSPWQAVLFLLINQMLFGLYSASVFAPNHKGMPILEDDSRMDFIHRQVLTARNVKSHPLTDFWYGGLNYQIEHHLFSTAPRNRLRKLQKIVRSFCEERSIAYHETGVLRSYAEILRNLHSVSAPLRGSKSTTPPAARYLETSLRNLDDPARSEQSPADR